MYAVFMGKHKNGAFCIRIVLKYWFCYDIIVIWNKNLGGEEAWAM